MPRSGEEEQYKYLPIECPKCGLQGKIKISRLDQTFACKQCKRVFHVTLDGVVLGERPPDAPTGLGESMPERQPWLVRRIEQLPAVGKYLLAGVLLLGALYWVATLMEPGEPLPGELEARAELLAKSVAHGDWSTVKRLAKPRTERKLGEWYDIVRPRDWDVSKDTVVQVELGKGRKIPKKSDGKSPAFDVQMSAKIEIAGTPGTELHLVFNKDESSDWWLDGEAMLKRATITKQPTKAKK